VTGDATLELTLSQFWSSLGSSSMEVELSFHGLDAQPAAGALQTLCVGVMRTLISLKHIASLQVSDAGAVQILKHAAGYSAVDLLWAGLRALQLPAKCYCNNSASSSIAVAPSCQG
jgi:hypothetical protein